MSLQAAIFSETYVPAGCKARYPWHRPGNARAPGSRRPGDLSTGGTTLGAGARDREVAVAGDRRATGALDGTGAAGTPPGRAAVGAPGRPWSRYDDARTA